MSCVLPTLGLKARHILLHRLTTLLLIAVATLLAFHPNSQAFSAETDRPPNIVVIFIDDMGYADIGPFGASDYPTPNLDQLAAGGRTFTDFYVTQAVCSASRAGLMTGCYNVRVGIQGALGPNAKIGINPDETTMAELCKQKGYATACYGKWHLGDRQPFLPLQNGFDDYFGLPYSNDMWPYHPGVRHLSMEDRLKRWPHLPLYDKNEVVNPAVDGEAQEQLTTQYTEKAVSFIDQHKDEPFFLYLPHSMVHVPLYVSEKFKGKSGAGLYGDVVMEVDWSVGQIVDALKRNQIEDNTLVIFTSDNGPWLSYGDHAGSAGPLREGKGTMWEGGCREPTIMSWPGKIPAGTVCDTPAMTIDIFPTVAKLIGVNLPEQPIDGKDIWPLISGEPSAKSPHEAYFFYYGSGLKAVRSGKWKLVFPHQYRTLAGRPGGTGGIPTNYEQATTPLALFDLEADPGEQTNLVEQHPEVVQRLDKLADGIREKLGDSHQKVKGTENRPPGRI